MKKLLFIIAVLLGSIALQAQTEIKINQPYRYLKSPYVLLGTDTAATKAYVRSVYATATLTTYGAGTGITLSGTTFSQTAHTGDATGSASLTVVALRGRSLSTIVPSSGNVLKFDGTFWYPVAP